MSNIPKEIIDKSYTYEDYVKLIDNLLSGIKIQGYNLSDEYSRYIRINIQRMIRVEKTFNIKEELKKELEELNTNFIWVVITEPWCGDAANIVPVLAKISEYNEKITCRFILRDLNPEIMDKYLTDGKRAIPKLICLEANTYNELGIWGPRPKKLQEKILMIKSQSNYNTDELHKEIQKWYFEDNTKEIQKEILENIKIWKLK